MHCIVLYTYGAGVLPPNAEESNWPNAYPHINRYKVSTSAVLIVAQNVTLS